MRVLETEADIAEGVAALIKVEPRFAAVIAAHGLPPLRRSADGLEGLLRIVTDQLISIKAGEAIWGRVEQALHPFDAKIIARKRQTTLMGLGLSGAKARCFKAIAMAVADGSLDPADLHQHRDEHVIGQLTAITGIGRWTAMIYLLAAMGRADAWPVGDLALELAAQHLLGLAERPQGRQMMALAEPWRPYRAVAARLLWSHYRGIKGMSQKVG